MHFSLDGTTTEQSMSCLSRAVALQKLMLMHFRLPAALSSSIARGTACHADVVLFMGMVLDPPMIVSEWCSRGSVYDILQKASRTRALAAHLTWHRRLHMALDAAKVSCPSQI